MNVNPFTSSLTLEDVMVLVKGEDSDNFKKTTVRSAFLDVASLWDFYFGGALVIEKFAIDGGDLIIYNKTGNDTTHHSSYELSTIIKRIELNAIRYQIQDIAFSDFNLTIIKDSAQLPISIKHLEMRAHDLYLSADSILKRKSLVEFSLPGQQIQLQNGLLIGFDSLFFSTRNNAFQLNKLVLRSPRDTTGNYYHVNADKVRIAHFNFETLYRKGSIVVDTIFLGHSNLAVNWKLESLKNNSGGKVSLPSISDIEVLHLIVSDLASDITVSQHTVENSFMVENAFVTAEQLRLNPDSVHRISTRDFNILLSKYSTFLSNKSTSISFDTVQIQKNQLSLLNFKLADADQKYPILQSPSFKLQEVDWFALLIEKKLSAREAIILNPIVHTSIKPKRNSSQGENLVVLNSLREFLEVQFFTLKNAVAFVTLAGKDTDIILRGTNATVRVDEMMESKDINQGLSAIENFSFRSLLINRTDFKAQIENFNFRKGSPFLESIIYKVPDKINFSASDISLGRFNWDESQNYFRLDGLNWKEMDIDIAFAEPVIQKNRSEKKPLIRINAIRGRETKIGFTNKNLKLSTALHEVNLREFNWNDSIWVNGLDAQGSDFDYYSQPNHGKINSFSLTDYGGILKSVNFNQGNADALDMHINGITFSADMNRLIQRKIFINDLQVEGMKTHFLKQDSVQRTEVNIENTMGATDISYKEGKFSVGSVSLFSGPTQIVQETKVQNIKKETSTSAKIIGRRFKTGIDTLLQSKYSIHSLQQQNQPEPLEPFTIKTTQVQSGKNGIQLEINSLDASRDSMLHVRAVVNTLKLNQVRLASNDLSAFVSNGSINNLAFNTDQFKGFGNWMVDNYRIASIQDVSARMEAGGNSIQFNKLNYVPADASVNLSDFEFRPLKDKATFLNENYYQTNFMHAKIDSISLNQLNVKRFIEDSVIHLSSINLSAPNLEIDRDKTHPFFSTAVKLLPTNAFQKIGMKFKVDTLRVSDGKIKYTEKSRVTGKEGSIYFTKLQGLVTNVKNTDLVTDDSLYIYANTRFLDSAKVVLRVKESYHDTLAGFFLSTYVSPFHTSILNNALIPMVAVEFQSGYIDTLQMRAIGREYLSLGTMKFLYKDLKVNFLDKNDTARHSVKNQLLKLAANTFVIRSNNRKRIGTLYYERDRNRAVFQYWVKMILSGATTSVGVKSNKKQIKKYKKELNQKRLPSIDGNFKL